MQCAKCGRRNRKIAAFCDGCGASLTLAQRTAGIVAERADPTHRAPEGAGADTARSPISGNLNEMVKARLARLAEHGASPLSPSSAIEHALELGQLMGLADVLDALDDSLTARLLDELPRPWRYSLLDKIDRASFRIQLKANGCAVPDGLSRREIEVLRLLAAGCSNRDIGSRLFISPNTVANHVRSILAKTGTGNRTEAAAYALRHNLLDTTGPNSHF